jgi:2-polyprenyl-3-methyl-5-hydroxy-6-metoxy-1,4-benzoquinol methylase
MPLPFGFTTQGEDRSETADLIFEEDLEGASVLDIGCCYGYFCYEAKRRKAGRVVGLEIDEDRFRQARKLQEVYRHQIELRNESFASILAEESFDYVLLLNVIHHLKDPVSTLHTIASSVRRRLIIEFPTFMDKRFRKSLPRLLPRLLNRLPLIGVASLEKADQTYVFSKEAIWRILMDHTRLFATVRFIQSPIQGRLIAICNKQTREAQRDVFPESSAVP